MEGDATLQQRHDLFVRQQERVQQQIEALQADLEKIQYKIWYYERALKRGTEAGPPGSCDRLKAEYARLHAAGLA